MLGRRRRFRAEADQPDEPDFWTWPELIARLLFVVEPSDRALTGWEPAIAKEHLNREG